MWASVGDREILAVDEEQSNQLFAGGDRQARSFRHISYFRDGREFVGHLVSIEGLCEIDYNSHNGGRNHTWDGRPD